MPLRPTASVTSTNGLIGSAGTAGETTTNSRTAARAGAADMRRPPRNGSMRGCHFLPGFTVSQSQSVEVAKAASGNVAVRVESVTPGEEPTILNGPDTGPFFAV